MKKYITIISLIGLIVVFQNCSDKSFSSRTDLTKALSVEPVLVEEEIPDVIQDDVNNDTGGRDVADNGDDDDKDNYDDDSDDDKDEYSKDDEDDDDDDYVRPPKKDEKRPRTSCKNRKDGNARFVCILAGPGKSTHVAVSDGSAIADNSTPKTACMSEEACENIVGQKMDVKSVESRGYCKNGTPQVLVLTDSEVQKLMEKIR
jgi:hypothetical protein